MRLPADNMFAAKTLLAIFMVAMVAALPTNDQDILTGQYFPKLPEGDDDIDKIFKSVNLMHKPHLYSAPPVPNFEDDVLGTAPSSKEIDDDSSKLQLSFVKAFDKSEASNPDMDKLDKMTSVDDVNSEDDEEALNRENPEAVFESMGAMPVKVAGSDMQALAVATAATKPDYRPSEPISGGITKKNVDVDEIVASESKSVQKMGAVVEAAETAGKQMSAKQADKDKKIVKAEIKTIKADKADKAKPSNSESSTKAAVKLNVGSSNKKEGEKKTGAHGGAGQMTPQVCIIALATVAAVMAAH